MAEIINLKHARKQKARDEKDKRSALNREKFGRSKSEKELTNAERKREETSLDGHKRDE